MKGTKSKAKKSSRSGAGIPSKGKVGIFWVFRGGILAASFAVQDGEKYGDAINGLTDHVKYWPRFQNQLPELIDLEYQDIPRGRVLFMKPSQEFHVYMDKVLHNSKTKRALLKEFSLPPKSSRFRTDAHYTTDSDELENLLS